MNAKPSARAARKVWEDAHPLRRMLYEARYEVKQSRIALNRLEAES
jgi:hypothetical protein